MANDDKPPRVKRPRGMRRFMLVEGDDNMLAEVEQPLVGGEDDDEPAGSHQKVEAFRNKKASNELLELLERFHKHGYGQYEKKD